MGNEKKVQKWSGVCDVWVESGEKFVVEVEFEIGEEEGKEMVEFCKGMLKDKGWSKEEGWEFCWEKLIIDVVEEKKWERVRELVEGVVEEVDLVEGWNVEGESWGVMEE